MLELQGYSSLTTDCAAVWLPDEWLLSLSGADAVSWLQGQLTNDLRALGREGSVSGCLATPTGQLEAVCRVWPSGRDLLVATSSPSEFEARVAGFVVIEDVRVERLRQGLWTVQGPKAGKGVRLPSPRLFDGGYDAETQPGVPPASLAAFEVVALEQGRPLFGQDTLPKTLPPELGSWFERTHVSYDKGCYTGQEVLQRIHSRGHTNRTWVVLATEQAAERGAAVLGPEAAVGEVTRSAVSPRFGPLAGAFVRNEWLFGQGLEVSGAGPARLHPTPG